MTTETIIANTKQMIDDLKTVCANFGLGNASSEYKIITEIFLYKFLNDKFLYEVQQAEESLKDSDNVEQALNDMSEDDYEMLMMLLPPATAKLKKEHFISYLFNHKNDDKFNELFDSTLWDISNTNLDVFSVSTGSGDKIRLFDEHLSQNVTESNRRSDFCKAMIDKLVTFSFADAFSQKYDFFATIFEYLIKDYNKDFGKYAEYYTPHSIASIIARIMVPEGTQNVTVYDPAAGSGTLVLALAHEIGESNCTIYTQDISQNGEFNVKHYTGKFNAYQRTYVLIPDLEYYALLYLASMYQIKSFKSAASGSIVKFITKGDIENIPVFIPDNKAILNKFNCLLMLQEQYQKESDELATIRDWLLPMLMNGQAAIED